MAKKFSGVRIHGLCVRFGEKILFHDGELSAFSSVCRTIVGENGCGKSTLLKIIAGKIHDFEGSLEVRGSVGYLPQTFEAFENSFALYHAFKYSHNLDLIDFCHTSNHLLFIKSMACRVLSISGKRFFLDCCKNGDGSKGFRKIFL